MNSKLVFARFEGRMYRVTDIKESTLDMPKGAKFILANKELMLTVQGCSKVKVGQICNPRKLLGV